MAVSRPPSAIPGSHRVLLGASRLRSGYAPRHVPYRPSRCYELVTHGSCYSYKDSFLDLDSTYTDAVGRPLLRMTFDFHDNELKMSKFITDKLGEIAQKMGPRQTEIKPRTGPYDISKYQTTHTCGGAVVGDDPKTSALNRYLQSWDVSNLFVLGATAYPQQGRATIRRIPSECLLDSGGHPRQISQESKPAGAHLIGRGAMKTIAASWLLASIVCSAANAAGDDQAYSQIERGSIWRQPAMIRRTARSSAAVSGDSRRLHGVPHADGR